MKSGRPSVADWLAGRVSGVSESMHLPLKGESTQNLVSKQYRCLEVKIFLPFVAVKRKNA